VNAGPTDHVVVVGAGLAGLSAALHLAGAGRRVTVLERESFPGGRAARVVRKGGGGTYHLDSGPTVLTMPELLEDCFAAVGESLGDHVTLRRLDPAYRARFADGTTLDLTSDRDKMVQRISEFAGAAEARGYERYVDFVTTLYRLEVRDFIDRNFDSVLGLARPSLARLAGLRAFSRLAPTVARYFRDERLQRVFTFQSLYAGLSPQRALALYAVISYMDLVAGVSYPDGGMHAIPTAMTGAASRAGVELVYDTEVSQVRWQGNRVSRLVAADGRSWSADAVVMTPDAPLARRLLGRPAARESTTRYSPSCVVLAAGLRTGWPAQAHHTMTFGRTWSGVFEDLEHGRLMRDPSFLVSLPSTTDPSLAPPGHSSAYVLFPAPNLAAGQLDWGRLRVPYREHMLSTVERAGFSGFSDAIEVEELITPADWDERGMAAGTPFAAAHTFGQTGPFRLPNHVGANVVLAGSGTVPGVGVPMVLISGRLAAERLVGVDPAYRSRAWR
jgi:phytoene desaturase